LAPVLVSFLRRAGIIRGPNSQAYQTDAQFACGTLGFHNQGLASHLLANLHGRSLKIDTCHLSTLPTNPTGANSCTELRGVEPANLAYSIPQPQHALEGQT
jgi:hypothetical protein